MNVESQAAGGARPKGEGGPDLPVAWFRHLISNLRVEE
jgi:hypothetical protein